MSAAAGFAHPWTPLSPGISASAADPKTRTYRRSRPPTWSELSGIGVPSLIPSGRKRHAPLRTRSPARTSNTGRPEPSRRSTQRRSTPFVPRARRPDPKLVGSPRCRFAGTNPSPRAQAFVGTGWSLRRSTRWRLRLLMSRRYPRRLRRWVSGISSAEDRGAKPGRMRR